MSLISHGQPMDAEAKLDLLSQQLDELHGWYKRSFIGSWVVIAAATGFFVYSYLPSQIQPLRDRLNEINSRLEKIEIKLDSVRDQISAISTQLQELRSRSAQPAAQPKTPAPRPTRKHPAKR